MPEEELEKQISAAYDFRGHVTIRFKSGEEAEGFLFNREFKGPGLPEEGFIEVILKGSGDRRRYPVASLASVTLTGEDCAAGKSHEDYLRKKAAEKR